MTEERYSRNIGALTEEEQLLLQQKRVFLAGCGGLGGALFAHLLRIGFGSVTAIDGDVFEITNLNRQLLSTMDLLGHAKADAAAQYAHAVNPSVHVETKKIFLTEENCDALIAGHDLVFDALDNIESRRILSSACDRLHIPMVYGAIRGWSAQAGVFPPGTASQRISMLYPASAALNDKSCLAFTPALCASLQAAEAVKYLLQKNSCLTDRLVYVDLLEQEFEKIPF